MPGGGLPVVVHLVVEASCPRIESGQVDLSPLLVSGAQTTSTSQCTQDGLDGVLTFDALLPASSTVVLTPGEVRGVVVDAARASAAGEVTVRYEPDGGSLAPVATAYGDGEDEPARPA
ncbi:hypothetical protein [Quadrisphaera sp. KR29]|uniref:hypothetical protein n=1 Tax=Quadrisphaera sp. KR29 TaxID=3461391 RepID=UPI0040445EA5